MGWSSLVPYRHLLVALGIPKTIPLFHHEISNFKYLNAYILIFRKLPPKFRQISKIKNDWTKQRSRL